MRLNGAYYLFLFLVILFVGLYITDSFTGMVVESIPGDSICNIDGVKGKIYIPEGKYNYQYIRGDNPSRDLSTLFSDDCKAQEEEFNKLCLEVVKKCGQKTPSCSILVNSPVESFCSEKAISEAVTCVDIYDYSMPETQRLRGVRCTYREFEKDLGQCSCAGKLPPAGLLKDPFEGDKSEEVYDDGDPQPIQKIGVEEDNNEVSGEVEPRLGQEAEAEDNSLHWYMRFFR